ncbi:type 1 glutamine amidotransferase [Altererythrobacter sp.]|uniref:type 1 glutamine amidotransferase n=1 Tax=Altererythrobacter sp. TaxID=1872480 RepID=UPI003CFCE80F
MKKILLMEGSNLPARERAARLGQETTAGVYERSLLAEDPDLHIDVLFGADEGAEPKRPLEWYDGFVISGSALHAYDDLPEVTRQVEWVRRVADTGTPIFGSCWGLQICAVAGGGMVERSNAHAEMGVARKIVPTDAGRAHALLAGRPESFDAPCIHYDHVARLPDNSVLLATNSRCPVQAALIPIGRSVAWGVQYHPEFDLPHLAEIYEGYGDDMVGTAFFDTRAALDNHIADLRAADAAPPDAPVAWRLGIDSDLLHGPTRRTELRNWLQHLG